MLQRIAIQGYEGSFHHIAANALLGKETEVLPCDTFRDLVRLAAQPRKAEGGLMAIENSIAGSILPNYALLQTSDLVITGEVYLRIGQHLMVNPGVRLEDIREVHSHPMALLQCMQYLEKHPHWKLVETEDTALSARLVHQHRKKHVAAIASRLAAELYGLELIAPNIQTVRKNFTRFLLLRRGPQEAAPEANKASIRFVTDHHRGSLARVLTAIADCGVNLSKLQSLPIPEAEWTYAFHADLEFEEAAQLAAALDAIRERAGSLRVFGQYHKGVTVS